MGDARALHYKYFELINYLFVDGNPAGVKVALKLLNIMEVDVRLPLVNVTSPTFDKIKEIVSKY